MTRYPLMIFLQLIFAINVFAQATPDSAAYKQIVAIEQQLLDAIALGNKSVWEKYLADSCLITIEEGQFLRKSQLVEDLGPLPKGYSGKIEMKDIHFQSYGNVTTLAYLADEYETIFGQTINTQYRTTNTYLRINGEWKIISSEVLAIPKHPIPIELDSSILDSCVGEYQLAEGVTYTITRDGNKLMGQRTGRKKVELSAENGSTFYFVGSRGTKVFVKDKSGAVTTMLDRRDGNDIVWKRVR